MSKWRSWGSKEIGELNDQLETNDNTPGSSKSCMSAKGWIKSENKNNGLQYNVYCLSFRVFINSGSDFKVRLNISLFVKFLHLITSFVICILVYIHVGI